MPGRQKTWWHAGLVASGRVPNPILLGDPAWRARYEAAYKERHGKGVEIAERLGLRMKADGNRDTTMLSKLRDGVGTLEFAVRASLALGILPPTAWLPDGYRRVLEATFGALSAGAETDDIVAAIAPIERTARKHQGEAPAQPPLDKRTPARPPAKHPIRKAR